MAALGAPLAARADVPLAQPVDAFVRTYCVRCHSDAKAKAGIDFEAARQSLDTSEDAELWQRVADMLSLGEMPPENAPLQPSDTERQAILESLTRSLAEWRNVNNSGRGRTVLRRLNSEETCNTLEDVFGVPLSAEMIEEFPADEEEDGFRVVGERLGMSSNRLDALMNAVIQISERALDTLDSGGGVTWKLAGMNLAVTALHPTGEHNERMQAIIEALDNGEQIDRESLLSAPMTRNPNAPGLAESYIGVRLSSYQFHDGNLVIVKVAGRPQQLRPPAAECGTPNVPIGGLYRYRARVGTVGDPDAQLSLRVGIRHRRTGRGEGSLPGVRTLQMHDAPPIEDALVVEGTAWIRAGERLIVQSLGDPSIGVGMREEDVLASDVPGLVVESIELAPLVDPELAARRAFLFGPAGREAEVRRPALAKLLRLAFRRSIDDEEVALFDSFYDAPAVARGYLTHAEAMQDLLISVFTSPRSLYLDESPGDLDSYALATRLALLLWRSIPDDELLESAESGRLLETAVLHAQVERMLDDPRSERLGRDFLDQWLDLSKFGEMVPDSDLYPGWNPILEHSMRAQTRRFFGRMLAEDLPIIDFIAADWTVLNETLRKHYGISGETVAGLEVFELAQEFRSRGGLLGMGSLLNLTTNGTVSSPVHRGVWVTERLLGRRPTPPPPDIDPLEPDIRGASSILEQLERHVSVEACASCHTKIDPFGVPLEEFDVLGVKRRHYQGVQVTETRNRRRQKKVRIDGAPVVTKTTLPDGTSVEGTVGLQQWLLANRSLFAHCLTTKLLTFATGRSMHREDEATIAAIIERAGGASAGLRSLLKEVVASETFRMNGSKPVDEGAHGSEAGGG